MASGETSFPPCSFMCIPLLRILLNPINFCARMAKHINLNGSAEKGGLCEISLGKGLLILQWDIQRSWVS